MASKSIQVHQKDMDVTRGCPGYEGALQGNWNGNVSFGDATVLLPKTMDELCRMVRDADQLPVRVVGRGHSFTPLALGGTILCLQHLNRILDYRPPSSKTDGFITCEGGTTYTEVIQFLNQQAPQERGALPNLPSCPQFTIAGAIATGTHGSGIHIHNLSAHVSMLEFVQANGSLVRYDRSDPSTQDILKKCRIHLGCLGVISRLTLDIVPYYSVEAVRYDDIPLETVIANLPEWWTRCDSLSVWTSGFGKGVGKGTCWATFRRFVVEEAKKDDDDDAPAVDLPTFLTPQELGDKGHVCNRSIPRYCTDPRQPEGFVPTGRGPWYDYLTVTMDGGKETCMTTKDLQAEFFVPLRYAQAALRAVWDAAREVSFSPPWGYQPTSADKEPPQRGVIDAMEFRQVKAGDGAWLSPHNDQYPAIINDKDYDDDGETQPGKSCSALLGIHMSFNGDPALRNDILKTYLPRIEQALEPFGGRPHWGKLSTNYRYSHVQTVYPTEALEQFQSLCQKHDPTGKFRNEFIQRALFGE
ncbi:gulono-1,4-lactone dehydrogenase [Seminavis robusta]|uniref:Gulono-1,4-lactone dehydrogenase n=1 Tax=Seminavis robusta TaxID=568900 RepID=A0A9N8EF46_9STRA|nr:gulono-1,4-lactone dehydrogenase [Seminavis robusta]|eukprot:Sro1096_g240750.1 gulono-1,4-lactone dehydrogenase (527) ;mRNA; f:11089-12669